MARRTGGDRKAIPNIDRTPPESLTPSVDTAATLLDLRSLILAILPDNTTSCSIIFPERRLLTCYCRIMPKLTDALQAVQKSVTDVKGIVLDNGPCAAHAKPSIQNNAATVLE